MGVLLFSTIRPSPILLTFWSWTSPLEEWLDDAAPPLAVGGGSDLGLLSQLLQQPIAADYPRALVVAFIFTPWVILNPHSVQNVQAPFTYHYNSLRVGVWGLIMRGETVVDVVTRLLDILCQARVLTFNWPIRSEYRMRKKREKLRELLVDLNVKIIGKLLDSNKRYNTCHWLLLESKV